MKAVEIQDQVTAAGGSVHLSPGGKLLVTAPAALPLAVIENLRLHKGELVSLLSNTSTGDRRQRLGCSRREGGAADQSTLDGAVFAFAPEETHRYFERWHRRFGNRSPYGIDEATGQWAREILRLSGARIVGQQGQYEIAVWPERKNFELQLALRLLRLGHFELREREK